MNLELQIQRQVGQRIRELRQLRRRTIQHLAQDIDLDPGFLGQIERGVGTPSLNTLYRSAQSLGVQPAELFLQGTEFPSATYVGQELHHFLKRSNQHQRRIILDFLSWLTHHKPKSPSERRTKPNES